MYLYSNIFQLYIREKNRSTFTGKTVKNLIYSINYIYVGLLKISMFFHYFSSFSTLSHALKTKPKCLLLHFHKNRYKRRAKLTHQGLLFLILLILLTLYNIKIYRSEKGNCVHTLINCGNIPHKSVNLITDKKRLITRTSE